MGSKDIMLQSIRNHLIIGPDTGRGSSSMLFKRMGRPGVIIAFICMDQPDPAD